MSDSENEQLQQIMQRFIDLANVIKDEGIEPRIITVGLMRASCVYSTYVVAGNEGGLNESGVEKVAEAYKQQLAHIQQLKRQAGDPEQLQ